MSTNKLKENKNIYWIIFFILLGTITWAFVGIDFHFSNTKSALNTAQNRWTQHEITDYTIIINFINAYYLASFEMEVQDNQVTKVYNIGSPLQLREDSTSTRTEISALPEWYDLYFASQFPPTLEDYEITSLFDYVDRAINSETNNSLVSLCSTDVQLQISYNTEYGYPSQVSYSNCQNWDFGLGLMCPTISHCQTGFSIAGFEEK